MNRTLKLKAIFSNVTLWLIELVGHEAYSDPGQFDLIVLADDINLHLEEWIGKRLQFSVLPVDQSPRHFSGYVMSMQYLNYASRDYRYYKLTLSSWFKLLKDSQHSRGFYQDAPQSLISIIETCLQPYPFKNIQYEKEIAQVNVNPDIVQYNESDLQFISRLLASSNIFYWLDYQDTSQWMKLAMTSQAYRHIVHSLIGPDEKVHWNIQSLQPQFYLTSRLATMSLGQQYTLQEMLKIVPIHVVHYAKEMGGLPSTVAPLQQHILPENWRNRPEADYENQITAIPLIDAPYLPTCLYGKPKIKNYLTGFVVGSFESKFGSKTEIDELARVRVWFPWDENNPQKNVSKCPWIRIRQLEAGNKWGHLFVPCVGDEVVVMTTEDDSNQLVIVGSVYNAKTPIPFKLSKAPSINGIKTEKNALFFTNSENKEQFVLHAGGSFQQNVNGNVDRTIMGNDCSAITNGETIQIVEGNYTVKANQFIMLSSGASQITITENKILISGDSIQFTTKNNLPTHAIALKGSTHQCPKQEPDGKPHQGGPIKQGSSNVFIEGKSVARVGDRIKCDGPDDIIKQGHPNLLVNNKRVACETHETEHGGKVTSGAKTVVAAGDSSLLP